MKRVSLLVFLCLAIAATMSGANNGTMMTVTAQSDAGVCDPSNSLATFTLSVTATSSASASPADLRVSTDGGATYTTVATGKSSQWVHDNRTKTWQTTVPVTVAANTSSNLSVCVVQPGADKKSACTTVFVAPSCAPQPPATCPCFTTADILAHMDFLPLSPSALSCNGAFSANECDAEAILSSSSDSTCRIKAGVPGPLPGYLLDSVGYEFGVYRCSHEEATFGFSSKINAGEVRACAVVISDAIAARSLVCGN